MKKAIHNIAILGLTIVSVLFISSCKKGGEHGHEGAHWSYEGETGPASWGDLNEEFETCKLGKAQSPIDISGNMIPEKEDLTFNYSAADATVVNNGHTIQVSLTNGGSITTEGKTFQLVQFHFHAPGEHTINGKAAPMVAHLVHKNEKGELAVVEVSMNEGGSNSVIESIWNSIPQEEGKESPLADKINAGDLLPAKKGYYNYIGSLTTPPCTEGVNWFVFANPIQVSSNNVSKFKSIFPASVRPTQPLNDREVNISK